MAAWVERLVPARRKVSEGRITAAAFGGLGAVFSDVRKSRPYSVLLYPTTSTIPPCLSQASMWLGRTHQHRGLWLMKIVIYLLRVVLLPASIFPASVIA